MKGLAPASSTVERLCRLEYALSAEMRAGVKFAVARSTRSGKYGAWA
jgi:hypothetical protein